MEDEVCVHIVFTLSQYCDIARDRWRMRYVFILCLYCLNIVILPETDGEGGICMHVHIVLILSKYCKIGRFR